MAEKTLIDIICSCVDAEIEAYDNKVPYTVIAFYKGKVVVPVLYKA